ncbi:STAS domain-containing protein [Silvimonas iriomotensis]|uniref:STAS domain-containing protein n=1 Tax=Silvimonas iriomotensis TaxID=449662 RepID=A0ABQ2PDX0_9NEIS|nr:hypothetical protein [Silvimonas iriomotensis]GGP23439.1 hypothetical protein GCM10010970_34390 [Silvimonas iriomotensis]
MVFSFFKKKEGDGKPESQTSGPVTSPRAPAPAPATGAPAAAPASAPAPTAAAPKAPAAPGKAPAPAAAAPAPEPSSYNLQELTIEVADTGTHLTAEEEEAVVLYANGQTAAAATGLRNALQGITGQRRHESWAMLFELYQQLNKRAEFDELALMYVVEFESTPPLWREGVAAATAAPRPAAAGAAGGAGYISLPASLNGDNTSKEVDRLVKTCKAGTQVKLDMAKVTAIDSMAAAELLFGWQSVRKVGGVVQIAGAETMIKLLSSKIETGRTAPAEAPYWLLLLETTQATGNQEAFENLAIDYAVTYEVSPPSWDGSAVFTAPAPKVAAPKPDTAATPTPSAHSPDRLVLTGALLQGAAAQIQSIRDFASKQGKPVLDFRDVTRVDFETAGQLLNLAMELVQTGAVVRIASANALVAGMLHLMGVGELIEIGGN